MRRIALLAVSQCFGIFAFCQSPTSTPGPLQSLNNNILEPSFSGQLARISPPTGLPGLSRFSAVVNGTQANSPSEITKRFQTPFLNAQVFAITAQNNLQNPPSLQGPRGKSMPIPTQFPNAKPEKIPTTWPNLKLLPIAPNNSIPAK